MSLDVVIAGRGVAGGRLAGLLASAGLRVMSIGPDQRPKPYFESLSSTVFRLLPAGALSRPCTVSRSAWGSDDLFERAGILNPHGHDWFVERATLTSALRAEADAAGAACLSAQVLSADRRSGRWIIRTSAGDEVEASILVDATGRRSSIGTRLGGRRIALDRLVATSFRLDGAVRDFAPGTTVLALPSGWLYAGPGTRSAAVGIYFTDPDLEIYGDIGAPGRLQELLSSSPALEGCAAGPRYGAEAAFSDALLPCAGPGWLAVGDAAGSVDPLSSQGLTRAVQGADRAAEAILGGDLAAYAAGVEAACRNYAAERAAVYGRETRWREAPFWRRRIMRDGMSPE